MNQNVNYNEAYKMKDEYKPKKQLVNELAELRQRITELEASEIDRKQVENKLKEYSERLEEMVEERTKELQEAQEQLVRREKLAILDQLAGGMGHELRNTLCVIKNAAYFLKTVLEEAEPDVNKCLEILEKEVARSESIISSLFNFTRPKPPTRRKVDINHIVQEVLFHTTVPENVEVVSQLDESLPAVMADPDQLSQVFENIILNAIQAMPEGGQLVVKSEAQGPEWEDGFNNPLTPLNTPPWKGDKEESFGKGEVNHVAVSFADTGVGIPEENLGRIFEPLFTTKARGIGLGLAITRDLVEGHRGAIEVQSEVGKGSIFTVRIPTGVVYE